MGSLIQGLPILLLVLKACIAVDVANVKVTSITPKEGSVNGAVRITIFGKGFSVDQFNFGEGRENLGNKVTLVTDNGRSYECDPHKDGNTATQITCNTRKMAQDDYYVRLAIDGIQIPNENHCSSLYSSKCRFQARTSKSPTISSLGHTSNFPGEVQTINGKIFTTRYGSNVENTEVAPQKILRVFAGSQLCDPKKDTLGAADQLYGIKITKGNDGYIKCKGVGSYVGNSNFSYIIQDFGRSNPLSNTYRGTATDTITMYQTYADVISVTPNTGSEAGGTLLVITGRFFDKTDTKVQIAGTTCTVLSTEDTVIRCITDPKPSSFGETDLFAGNRGVLYERFTESTLLDDLQAAVEYNDTAVNSTHIDEMSWDESMFDPENNYVVRLKGFFIPPRDGTYRFIITKSDDNSELHFSQTGKMKDLKRIAIRARAKADNQLYSQKFNLTKDTPYPLIHVTRERTSSAYAEVGAHVFQTSLQGTGAADSVYSEKQDVTITSVVHNEIQTVKADNWKSQTKRSEKQRVTVISSFSTANFRLGLNGVFTAPIRSDASSSAVRSALEALSSLDSTVSVSASGNKFDITFNSELGDMDPLSAVWDVGIVDEDGTLTVQELTKGKTSMEKLALKFDGVTSMPISITASASEVQAAVEDLFSVRCPKYLTSPGGNPVYKQDYEGQRIYESGTRVSNVEAFCGTTCVKNPNWIYRWHTTHQPREINLKSTGTVCFAYMGKLQQRIYLSHTYTIGSSETSVGTVFNVEIPETTEWNYLCFDLWTLVQGRYPGVSRSIVTMVYIWRDTSSPDPIYIDNVLIASKKPSDDIAGIAKFHRQRPPQYMLNDVKVSGNSSYGYVIDMSLRGCPHNLPLFTALGAATKVSTGNDDATYSSSTWRNGATLVVTRNLAASPPVQGTYSLTFGSKSLTGISSEVEASDLKNLLQTLPNMGDVLVSRSGSCAGYKWSVTWQTATGDQEQMLMDGSALTGQGVNSSVITAREGGLRLSPIPGDFLRTFNKQPQVQVNINKIPSKCSGDCTFTWAAADTPTLESITPNSGSNADSTVVTLTGSGFSTVAGDNKVLIGGEPCSVSSATTTSIQCSVGQGPAGLQDVVVSVSPKGLANNTNGVLQFTYDVAITSISPDEGSLAGGTLLTIEGTGFSTNMTATVGGANCILINATYSTLTCQTPAASAGAVSVIVTDGVNPATAATSFTYATSKTPTVTGLNKSTFYLYDGGDITISGSGFGASASTNALTINGKTGTIVSYSDSEIVAKVPLCPPGNYPLFVYVYGKGYADTSTNSIPNVKFEMTVTNVFPLSGSMEGGTALTVTGTGFPTDPSKVKVTVNKKDCEVTSSSNTQVECTVPTPGVVHVITNDGIHPEFGKGYAWSKTPLEVLVGDTVKWVWNAPERSGSVYQVLEAISSTNDTQPEDGFSSGAKRSQGAYQYEFTTAGSYYYSSGTVNDDIILRGVVNVEERSASLNAIDVTCNGFSATHSIGSASDPANTDSCTPTNSEISGCTEPSLTASGSTFMYKYLKCKTPSITGISPSQGSADDTITITGSGFGGQSCQNMISIGDKSCNISVVATSSQITCKIDPTGDAVVGIPQRIGLLVKNIGNALNTVKSDLKRHFVLLPYVSAINPSSGSLKGGTDITITGSGFLGQVTVTIGTVVCDVSSATYTQILCTTRTAYEASEVLSVKVPSSGQMVEAVCQSPACNFQFSSSFTPTVSSATPSTISTNDTELSIQGTGFGSNANSVSVTLGNQPCTISALSDTSITCVVETPVAGTFKVEVKVPEGSADNSGVNSNTVNGMLYSVMPSVGGIRGGNRLRVKGLGFKTGDVAILVGNSNCKDLQVQNGEVSCTAPPGNPGSVKIQATSNAVSFSKIDYSYTSDTPTVTGLSTNSGSSGDVITISGTLFGTDPNLLSVTINNVDCQINPSSVTGTSFQCTLGVHPAGEYPVVVSHTGLGEAICSENFTYTLSLSTISPDSGSYGGGQNITLNGIGFDAANTTVTVCNEACTVIGSITPTQLTCVSPEKNVGGATEVCEVKVLVTNQMATSSFTYSQAKTPTITDVTPRRGGTGGGTTVTITGTGFGTDMSQVNVDIAGETCTLVSVVADKVVCTTGSRKPSIKTKVKLSVGSNGEATKDQANFEYIDVWSSPFTWNNKMPEAGDFIVIPSDMTVLLDTNTPVLKMILINGGKLIFDEKDVELQAESILITNGGLLQVGTEEEPFQHNAIITLFGHPLSKELPIYGTKNIAVREGTLDLHGKPPNYSWTLLGATAEIGATQVTLKHAVNWQVGDYVAIGSTGDDHSQEQNEMRRIDGVTNGGLTLTLDSPLTYKHLGELVDLWNNEETLEAYAPIGLLTRNVLVRGSNNSQWTEVIEACPDGFDPGEFVTQTCFQGRHGEEIGSDEFGVQIMMHAAKPDLQLVTGRIENIEMTYAGQAFRIGRYAIHFHLNGDMPNSYVKNCAIHHSFNRAVNIHGTHYVLLQGNVVYDILGGAVFLEDGIEIGNTFDSNLAIFVKGSSSLQNDDITPAAFWLTNPNNTVTNNYAAGGTHFGVWYRMHKHPDGPSYDPNYCPQVIPLGTFRNNTVMSHGWFGIWIFMEYYPMEGGGCDSTTPIAAKFYSLIAWNNEKGGECVNCGATQFHDCKFVNNKLAGFEWKMMANAVSFSEDRGGMIKDCVFAAHPADKSKMVDLTTKVAIVTPYARGLLMASLIFINFDQSGSAAFRVTTVDGTTADNNGGFEYHTKALTFHNSPNKIKWRWIHEAVYVDLDGTLTGIVGGKVVPTSGILPSGKCKHNDGMSVNANVPGSICEADVEFVRFSFNKALPASLDSKDAIFTNVHGQTFGTFEDKRVTHKLGWMVLLVKKTSYIMEFRYSAQITNITYTGTFYSLDDDDWIIISHNFTQSPDRFQISKDGSGNGTTNLVTFEANNNGDYYFDKEKKMLSYLITGKQSRKKRAVALNPPASGTFDREIKLNVFQCFIENCAQPLDPNMVPPPSSRPADFVFWSNVTAWKNTKAGYGGNYGDGTFGLPRGGVNEDVMIPAGVYMVADVPLPVMGKLYIEGVLELEHLPINNGKVPDFTLNCSFIIINGGRLVVGWEDKPYTGNANIVLRGDLHTPEIPLLSGPNIGAKALAVFGGLELHGINRTVTWTRLKQTASSGSNSLVLSESVDWSVGDEIVIAPTSYKPKEAEIMKITSVDNDGKTLTLNSTLKHTHLVTHTDVGESRIVTFAAEVGLLTHNIKIIGDSYDKMESEGFGARVLIGRFSATDPETGEKRELKGYARIDNVEFVHTGQLSFSDDYDPRFSIAYLDTGDVSEARPSSLRKSSFHHCFSPAIGTFGINEITISDNVIYRTVGSSIQDGGVRNALRRNLVVLMLFPGTYAGRDDGLQFWDAGIDNRRATLSILSGNAVAGSERSGYWVDGEPCDNSYSERWTDNTAHSVLIGVQTLYADGIAACSLFGNFTVYKAWDFGLYFQMFTGGVEVVGLTSADNTVGIYPMVLGPPSVSHQYANKFVNIKESTFIGKTADFDCVNDKVDPSDPNIKHSDNSRPSKHSFGGFAGIIMTVFSSGPNEAPYKPFANIMSYNTIGGLTTLTGNTLAKFKSHCPGKKDIALIPSPSNDDFQHPIRSYAMKKEDLDIGNLILLIRPNVGKVNPADCVDMDCDGMKKILIKDMDGTFFSNVKATVLSESEWQWDGDRRRGLGDYRIPKTLLTDLQGNRIPVTDIADHRGIIRDSTCELKDSYQAYECTGLDYLVMFLESMDSDTETRRLSPIAIVGDKYLDLINGPQDHGWCMGYTCQKRLSTFPIVVATGKYYILHYTGTSPQNTRFLLLNSDETQAIVIGIFYTIPQRLDLTVNDIYIPPTNAVLDKNGQQILNSPTSPGQYMPDVNTDPTGTNYFDRETNTLHVLVKGPTPVLITTSPLLIIGFNIPAMTTEDFYGVNLVNNLAIFLGIPPEKIKVAKAVSEKARRRKRDTVFKVELEISNPPSNSSNSSIPDPDALSYDQLQNMTSAVVNSVQLGTLGSILNVTILDFSVTEPVPSPESSAWKTVVATTESGQAYNLQVQIPKTLAVETEPVGLSEGNPLSVHPVLKVLDKNGAVVQQLGAKTSPWQVTATLVKVDSSFQASLTGNATVDFILGYANFTSLVIDYSGTYRFDYRISYPAEAVTLFTAQSADFTISERSLAVAVVSQDNETTVGQNFSVSAEIIDANTSAKVENIGWKNHTWTCTASLYMPDLYNGQLQGTLDVTVDPPTGVAVLNDLQVTSRGRYFIKLRMVSSPAGYVMETVSAAVEATPAGWVEPEVELTKRIKLRFNVDYSSTLTDGRAIYLEAAVKNEVYDSITAANVSVGSVTLTQGSIMASFDIQGSTTGVNSAVDTLHQKVSSGGFSVTFFGATLTADTVMWVDENQQAVSVPADAGLSAGIIAAIAICCVVTLIVVVLGFVLLKKKLDGKKKVGSQPEMSSNEPLVNNAAVEPQSTPRRTSVGYGAVQREDTGSSRDTAPTPSTQRRRSEGIQEITLDMSNVTTPIPISEQPFDEDEAEMAASETGRGSPATPGSGRTSSRAPSRPPSKPSIVWDDGTSGPSSKKLNPFPNLGKDSPYTVKLKSPLRKGVIAGKLPSIVDRRDSMPKKKKRMRKRDSAITIDTDGMQDFTINGTETSNGMLDDKHGSHDTSVSEANTSGDLGTPLV